MKIFACLIVSLVCGLASTFSFAACVDLSSATNWSIINSHKIIMYWESKAIAVLDIPSCDIHSSSSITVNNTYICNGDSIIVSGVACKIRNIEKP
jgi:hypothetical protein